MRDTFLVIHFIGLAMSVGTGFSNLFLGIAASKLAPAERGSFMIKTLILTRMGQIGLGLLLISGFYLITPYWAALSNMPTLIAKLTMVLLLVIMISIMSLRVRKAKEMNDPSLLASLRPLGMVVFVTGITVVILAVVTFH